VKGVFDKNEDFAVRCINFFVYVNLFGFRTRLSFFLFRSALKYLFVRTGVFQEVTVVCVAISFENPFLGTFAVNCVHYDVL
jgi:hypothetical protein